MLQCPDLYGYSSLLYKYLERAGSIFCSFMEGPRSSKTRFWRQLILSPSQFASTLDCKSSILYSTALHFNAFFDIMERTISGCPGNDFIDSAGYQDFIPWYSTVLERRPGRDLYAILNLFILCRILTTPSDRNIENL